MKSRWLFNRTLDLWVLFVPVWACWLIAFVLPADSLQSDIPLWVWVVVVVGIDVSHVWSSIHRTYFDPEEFRNHRRLFIAAPLLSLLLSFGLAAISVDLFWRCLAYVAVYHFVKQQFGFMRIYKAKSGDFRKKKINDNFIIYLSMLYPILFWHLHSDREFAWFVPGDFITLSLGRSVLGYFSIIGNLLYFVLIGYWIFEEVRFYRSTKDAFPFGKMLWTVTTALNWFLGIVYFNSDLVFTITNVVAHGVPYLALVIFYRIKKVEIQRADISKTRSLRITATVLLTVLLFALVEEYFWDSLIYRENEQFFGNLVSYSKSIPSELWQLLAIGFLAVPQVTHYILDGFIWKNNKKNPYLKKILLN